MDLGVSLSLGLGGAGRRITQSRHRASQLLEGTVHALQAVAEREKIGGDRPQIVALKERVDLARVQWVGGVERHVEGKSMIRKLKQ